MSDQYGQVTADPGFYRVGRKPLHAFNSHTVGVVRRDAERIATRIAARVGSAI